MLELDLRLLPFLENQFSTLNLNERKAYEALLAEEDWQIYDWLRRESSPEESELGEIVEKIIAFQMSTFKR